MTSRKRTGIPHRGDPVYVEGRKPQPNGAVIYVDYEDHSALVKFYGRTPKESTGVVEYSFYEFDGTFTHEYAGGTWMLPLKEED